MSTRKGGKDRGLNIFKITLLSSFFTIIVGFIFFVTQGLGELLGIVPTIQLGELEWGQAGDPIIIYVVVLMFSTFMGSFIVLLIVRKNKL